MNDYSVYYVYINSMVSTYTAKRTFIQHYIHTYVKCFIHTFIINLSTTIVQMCISSILIWTLHLYELYQYTMRKIIIYYILINHK